MRGRMRSRAEGGGWEQSGMSSRRSRMRKAGVKDISFIDSQVGGISSTTDERGERRLTMAKMGRKGAEKYLDVTTQEIAKGMLEKQKVDLSGINMGDDIQVILSTLKDKGRITDEGFLKDAGGKATSLKPQDIQLSLIHI